MKELVGKTKLRAVFALLAVIAGLALSPTFAARADTLTNSSDTLRTSWYSNQPGLANTQVTSGNFGQLFSTGIVGQVYAQPLVSQGTLFIATEMNNIYGLDPATGSIKWSRNVGNPFNPADLNCSDITQAVGITGTPVIDPATNIAYFVDKNYLSGTSGPTATYMHAVNVATGAEQAGFPVQIQGTAANDATHIFDSTHQLQRPGLLLLNGVVYAAFGAHCDRKPYEGWIAGVSTSGQLTTLWSDEAGVPQSQFPEAGIWMTGGGLMSDGPGQIIFASGNGDVPTSPTFGQTPPSTLGQSVVRLAVQPDGTLKATDFFSPYDNAYLNSTDSDLGAGAPVELPAQYFGTPTYPHLIVEVGKQGYIYVLNANNLGGFEQGPSSSDAVINRIGPNGGVWGKPAVWPGDGGYIYLTTAQGGGGSGKVKAYHYGLDGNGNPTFTLVGTTADTFGFSSSSPIVTSSGTTSGSALVWVIWSPDASGTGAQLRAYNPIPVSGTLQMVYSAPIGTAAKFTPPTADGNRVYVGTRDGHVLAFGSPVAATLTGAPVAFPSTIVGQTATATETLTATTNLTITAISANNSVFTVGAPTPALPATLSAGQTISIPITFTPTAVGLAAADLTVTTSAGITSFGLSGTGESSAAQISVDPAVVSFGGTAVNGTPVTTSTTFSNTGAQPLTITGITLPAAPFSATGLPAIGSTLAPGQSMTVTLTFAPTTLGLFTDELDVITTAGTGVAQMSGTAGQPQQIQITPMSINLGNVGVGTTATVSFQVANVGGSPLTITISKMPDSGVGFTATSSLPEGTVIAPGASLTETVTFKPFALGTVSDTWSINGDDNSGKQTVTFTGTGVTGVLPSLYASDVTVLRPLSGTATATFTVTLDAPSSVPVTVSYQTKNGTAIAANGDYVAIPPTTLTFQPGETSKTISVIINSSVYPGIDKTFTISLFNAVNALLGDAQGKAYVLNPLGAYYVTVGDVAVTASPTGTVTATFPVNINTAPAPGETVTVTVITADGSGIAGTDYVALPLTTLTFTNTSGLVQNVSVTVNSAAAGAGNKTFLLNLTGVSANAVIADSQALATIVNGGAAPLPSIYISDATVVQPTSGTVTETFTVTLSAASSATVKVNYATHDSGATVAAGDYVATSGTLTFAPGQTSQTVAVTVNAATRHSGVKYFYLNLSRPSNAFLSDVSGRGNLVNPLGRYFIYTGNPATVQSATGTTTVMVPVTLSAPVGTGETVTVQVSSNDGTATVADGDYVAVPLTTLTFTAGQQTILVPITINADPAVEGNETFTLNLSGASGNNAIISIAVATVTIVNHG